MRCSGCPHATLATAVHRTISWAARRSLMDPPFRRPTLALPTGAEGSAPWLLSLFAFLPLRQPGDRDQVIAFLQLDEAHSLGVPADGRDVRRVEPDDHTFFGDQHHPLVAAKELHSHHLAVATRGLDVDEPLAPAA